MMTSFNDFIREWKLNNKATSNIKIQQILSSLSLSHVGTYLGDGTFSLTIGIVNLHPKRRLHRVAYLIENCFGIYGCGPPNKPARFIIKRNGYGLLPEYKLPGLTCKRDSHCAVFLIYKLSNKRYKNGFRICFSKFLLSIDTITLTFSSK